MAETTGLTESRGQRDRPEVLWTLAVIAGSVALLVARAPFALRKFWAEDGTIFFQGARAEGPLSALFEDWAGYYHLLPRVAGEVSAAVPLRDASWANWLVVAAATAWCAATVFVSSRTWLENLPARLVLAAGVVLLPVVGVETIGNIANLHFIMLFPALLIAISKPRSRAEWINSVVFMLVTTLSTLETAVLLPLIAHRVLLQHARPRLDNITLAWLVGSVLHFALVLATGPDREVAERTSLASIAFNYAKRVVFENFSPTSRAAGFIGTVLLVVIGVVVLRAAQLAWSDDRHRALLLVAVPLVGAALWVVLGWRLGYTTPRYAVFPAMCLGWSLFVAVDVLCARPAAPPWASRWGVSLLAAAVLIVSWLPHWSPPAYRRDGPTWHELLDTAARRCAEEGGDAVVVQVPPARADEDRWPVELQCDELD